MALQGTPVVLYPLSEAASGTTPTEAVDIVNGYNLALNYGSSTMAYSELAAGKRGLTSTSTSGTHRGVRAIDNTSDVLRDALVGLQIVAMEFRLNVGTGNASGGRILAIGDSSGSTGRLALRHHGDADNWWIAFNDATIQLPVVGTTGLTLGSVHTLHVLIDTTQATQNDRVRICVNGGGSFIQVPNSIALNATLSIPAGHSLYLLNRLDGSSWARSIDGTVYHAAIYPGGLTLGNCQNNHTELAANDDTAGGAAPTGTVTISDVNPGITNAAVTYSYDAADQTGFEYRIDNGTAAAIGASVATITGLTASTTYNSPGLQVRAINGSGAGAWSTAVSFTTDASNAPPTWISTIPAMSAKRGQTIATYDVSVHANDPTPDAMTFSANGSWPAGISINSAGVMTRAPSVVPGVYALSVNVTDGINSPVASANFNFTVQQCVIDMQAAGRFLGAAVGSELSSGFAREAAEDFDITVYLGSQWPLTSAVLVAAAETTDANGYIAALGDDDLLFGTVYWVLGKRASDSEPFITRVAAS